jgi:hypothetical protein
MRWMRVNCFAGYDRLSNVFRVVALLRWCDYRGMTMLLPETRPNTRDISGHWI